jgi:hypothetical protein
MATILTYRGRAVSDGDVGQIRELIAAHPEHSRRGLSAKLCEVWGWTQPNGRPRDMVCRSLMLALHRAGHIELPAVRRRPPNPLARRARPGAVSDVERSPLRCRLAELGPLEFRQVRRSPAEALFNALIETHHYLGYTQPVGEQLKYLVYAGERPVACFAWSSAPRHLGPRDRHIGWAADQRRRNIHLVAYNPRFLILPWVEVAHLASHLLGRMVRLLPAEWERMYGHPVHCVLSAALQVAIFCDLPGRGRGGALSRRARRRWRAARRVRPGCRDSSRASRAQAAPRDGRRC